MSGPPPALARARLATRAALAGLPPGSTVLVACSGGADSLALAAVTAFVAPRLGLRAGAVVVDHGMQDGSHAVTARALGQCRDLGLDPLDGRRVVVATTPGSGGPEAAARTARYAALDRAAADHGALRVLLGHTADDQAETVLLGLARGSGARSLAGMREATGPYLRPFLGLRRRETEEICRTAGLAYWTDPSNDGSRPDAPLRSRVRHDVLPTLDRVLGPGVVEALVRTAEQLDEDDAALAALAGDLLVAARGATPGRPDDRAPRVADRRPSEASPVGGGPVSLDVATLGAAPTAVRRRALRRAAIDAGCRAGSLTRAHVLEIDRLVTDWHGQGPVHLPGAVGARRDCGRLVLHHLD